jgi:hypothetical protein
VDRRCCTGQRNRPGARDELAQDVTLRGTTITLTDFAAHSRMAFLDKERPITTSMVVTSADKAPIPAATFDVPAGYTAVPMK